MAIKTHESTRLKAIKLLRRKRLAQGLPFMINSHSLPTERCYLEFPDGSIKIAIANTHGSDFKIIRKLSESQAQALRKKLSLL